MLNKSIIIFIGFELCYYLLIAQTGVVESYNSDLELLAYLPIGGVIGSFIIPKININEKIKITVLLLIQFLLTTIYPKYNSFELFLLGLSVGGIAPVVIKTIKQATKIDLIISLSMAYILGALLFVVNPVNRGMIGICLSACILISFYLIDKDQEPKNNVLSNYTQVFSIEMMSIWVFLDSALFETISRDASMSIWRGGYQIEIITFHIIGIIVAVFDRSNKNVQLGIIMKSFIFSYLFYFLKEPMLMSIFYPFVISYYNVLILKTLSNNNDLKAIGLYMVFIGWVSSGCGLLIGISQMIIIVPILFLVGSLIILMNQSIKNYGGIT